MGRRWTFLARRGNHAPYQGRRRAEEVPGRTRRWAPVPAHTDAERQTRRQLGLLLALTFVTGVVDVVSLKLEDSFTANMTGNFVLIGAELSGARAVTVGPVVGAFAGFVVGAALAGRLLGRGTGSRWRSAGSLAGSGVMLAGIGLVLQISASTDVRAQTAATAALGLAMGIQAGWARTHCEPDLPTVVVTSTLVGLAFQSRLGSGESTRWQRRASALLLLVLGSLAGGLLLRIGPAAALGVAAGLLLAVATLGWVNRLGEPPASTPRVRDSQP